MTRTSYQKARLDRKDEIDFLRDIDLLTAIPPEQQPLYREADIEIGKQMMRQTYVLQKDKTKFGLNSNIQEFKIFGPGIYLLFKLLKYLTIGFGIVSLLAFINVALLVSAEAPRQTGVTNQIKVGVIKTTIYNLVPTYYSPYVGISFTIIVILTVFLIYWSEKEKQYVIQCLKVMPLSSYSTVILQSLPQNYSEHKLQLFLTQKFGQVAEIYTVRNFGDDLLYYKQMNQIAQDYKKQNTLNKLWPERRCNRQFDLFLQFRSGHLKIKQKIKDSESFPSVFAFIRFKKVEDKQKLLQLTNQINLFCCLKLQNKQLQLDANIQVDNRKDAQQQEYTLSKMDFTECQMQPCGILWQNLHLTKSKIILKSGLMILLVIIVLTLSIFLIFLISAIQMSVMNSKYKDMSIQQIQNSKDKYALLSYCINLSFSKFYQQSNICSVYNSEYIKFTIMIFMIPLSISLFKLLLTELMKALVNFRRYAYQIKKIQSQLTIIFVFYFLITGVLQLVIYLGNSQASIFRLFAPLIQTIIQNDFQPQKVMIFSDYDPNWYLVASYNIMMIGAISFNLSAIGIILYCKIRCKIFDYYAKKQKLQIQMNKWLTGYILQIQYVYAALLTIVYFTLLFGGSMPFLYPLAFLSFLILYWSNKYVFINFCAKPLTYNHSINRRVRKILFGAIIMHCIFTPVFFRAPQIGSLQTNQNFIQRILTFWYYILLIALVLAYLLLEKLARRLFSLAKKYIKAKRHVEKKNSGQERPLPHHIYRKSYELPTIVRKRHNELQLQPYSMHQNKCYKDILRTLYTINNKQRARKTCVLNKQLFNLYEGNRKVSENEQVKSKSLADLMKLVKKDFHKYGKRSRHNSNYIMKQKLTQIFQNSKKGKNHKYTLCNFGNFSAMRDMQTADGIVQTSDNFTHQQSIQKDDIENIQYKVMVNSKYLAKQNLSNLEQVIQASSCLEDQSQSKSRHPTTYSNRHGQQSFKPKASHFSNQVQTLPQSGKSLKNDPN